MTLVVRDDLSSRTALSKSALTGFDICGHKAWHDIHHRLPLIPDEKITFGSAVDAGVEAAIAYLRMGQPIDPAACYAAAAEIVTRDKVDLVFGGIERAIEDFLVQVAPGFDFAYARLQEHIAGESPDLGPFDGHPDVWLADGRIFDVKTAKRAKPETPSLELGFYALIGQEYSGKPVPSVGYWTWVRVARPYWQRLEFPVTDELLRWTVEKAAAYVRAKRADELLNKNAAEPVNWTFPSGPSFPTACASCQYVGICAIARKEVSDDAA
jgi:hypothetical protein